LDLSNHLSGFFSGITGQGPISPLAEAFSQYDPRGKTDRDPGQDWSQRSGASEKSHQEKQDNRTANGDQDAIQVETCYSGAA
jgi:hypothetical protein